MKRAVHIMKVQAIRYETKHVGDKTMSSQCTFCWSSLENDGN